MDANQVVADVLPSYRRWLHREAYRVAGPDDDRHHDDLVQEGYVAMWRAAQRYDPARGALPAFLTRAASQRMRHVAARGYRTWTGREPNRGHPAGNPEVLGVDELDVVADVRAVDALADVEWAYHAGDLAAALDGLTERQRRYVLLRFWHGWTPTELDAEFNGNHRYYWRRIKPYLARELRHLAPDGTVTVT